MIAEAEQAKIVAVAERDKAEKAKKVAEAEKAKAIKEAERLKAEKERRVHVEQAEQRRKRQQEAQAKKTSDEARVNDADDSSDTRSTVTHTSDRDNTKQTINVEATAYTAFCDTGCIGITATGVDVSNTIYHEGKRIIAVNPSQIPLGSTVNVTLSDGSSFEATAQDTGGDIVNGRIDLLVESTEEAMQFGRQEVSIEVVE